MSDSGHYFCPKCNGRDSYRAYNDAIVRQLIHFCSKCDLEMLLSVEAFDGQSIAILVAGVVLFVAVFWMFMDGFNLW
jgi:hypothetical protein